MRLPVVVRAEAIRDIEQARDYLELQRQGLGQAFLSRVDETLEQIRGMPRLYAVVWRNIRAARLRQFTYVVYYRVHRSNVEVLALLHGSRDTPTWKKRA